MDDRLKVLEGAKVVHFLVISRNTLTVAFDNGYELQVLSRGVDFDPPYWHLFMPDHMMISFGAEGHWTYGRSDIPRGEHDE